MMLRADSSSSASYSDGGNPFDEFDDETSTPRRGVTPPPPPPPLSFPMPPPHFPAPPTSIPSLTYHDGDDEYITSTARTARPSRGRRAQRCSSCLGEDESVELYCLCNDGYWHASCLKQWIENNLHVGVQESCRVCGMAYHLTRYGVYHIGTSTASGTVPQVCTLCMTEATEHNPVQAYCYCTDSRELWHVSCLKRFVTETKAHCCDVCHGAFALSSAYMREHATRSMRTRCCNFVKVPMVGFGIALVLVLLSAAMAALVRGILYLTTRRTDYNVGALIITPAPCVGDVVVGGALALFILFGYFVVNGLLSCCCRRRRQQREADTASSSSSSSSGAYATIRGGSTRPMLTRSPVRLGDDVIEMTPRRGAVALTTDDEDYAMAVDLALALSSDGGYGSDA